jgi:hypothetical protein
MLFESLDRSHPEADLSEYHLEEGSSFDLITLDST